MTTEANLGAMAEGNALGDLPNHPWPPGARVDFFCRFGQRYTPAFVDEVSTEQGPAWVVDANCGLRQMVHVSVRVGKVAGGRLTDAADALSVEAWRLQPRAPTRRI